MRIDAVPVAAEILEGQVTWPVPRDALSRPLEERNVAWDDHSTEEKHEFGSGSRSRWCGGAIGEKREAWVLWKCEEEYEPYVILLGDGIVTLIHYLALKERFGWLCPACFEGR